MILFHDDKDGGGHVFTLTLSRTDLELVPFDVGATEDADTIHEAVRMLSEYAEAVEDAWRERHHST